MGETGRLGALQVLYLTTMGRKTGLPRQIEIWFVASEGKLFILSEYPEKAHWVKNIRRNPRVRVCVGDAERSATARVLDPQADSELWRTAQRLASEKYGWGDGTPVEIIPDEPF